MAQQQQTTIPSTPVITNASQILLINGAGGQSPMRRCMFPGCTRTYSEHLWHIRLRSGSPVSRLLDTPRSTTTTTRTRIYGQFGTLLNDEQDVPEEYANATANMEEDSHQLLPLCDEVESELNARKWKPKDGLIVQDRCMLCLNETGIHWRFNECGCVCICDECAGDQETLWSLGDLAAERSSKRLVQWKRKWDWHCPCWWDGCNCQKELNSVLDPRPVCLNCHVARADLVVRALRKSTRTRRPPIRYSPMLK